MGWLKEGLYKKVGDGRDVSFWKKPWLDKKCLGMKYPRLFSMSVNQEAKVGDMGQWKNNVWHLNLQWRRVLFIWEETLLTDLQGQLSKVKLREDVFDEWRYSHSSDGVYSCKSAYMALSNSMMLFMQPDIPAVDEIFNKFGIHIIPSKVLAFGCQVSLDRAPSRMNLWKRNIINDLQELKCVFFCNEGV